jgi:hypothetical protein
MTTFTFTKLDNTNCVAGRITGGPRSNGNDYKYLGDFNSYEECAKSPNIPENAKAITYHNDKNIDYAAWEKQCFSINDTNTQLKNQDYATCGIVVPNSPKQPAASTTAPTVPTTMTSDATEELTEQINNLQKLENDKKIALDVLLTSNPSPDNVAQQEAIINDITSISTLRSNLFDILLNNASSHSKLNEQMNSNLENKNTIKTLKENSLNLERAALEAEDTTISNARRMVDINTYYHKQYAARVKIMKLIVLICFVIIFFIVLMHLGWLPQELVTVIVVITLLAGVIYIGYLVNDMYQRSKLNFDEYNFPFDSSKFGSQLSKSTKSAKASTDQSCSLYNSIASSAATVEDSISSKATELMNEVNGGTPDPSQPSSSLTSANANTGSDSGAAATPSVQTKLSESFIPLMSRMDRRQFNSNNTLHPAAYDTENNFGKI